MLNKYRLGIVVGFFTLVLLVAGCSRGTPPPVTSAPPVSQPPSPTASPSHPIVVPPNATPGASPAPAVSPTVTPDLSRPPASQEPAITELIPQGKMEQRNEANAVTIEAVLQSKLMVGARELVFNVTMDTHSVDLDVYDLSTLAMLRDSQGRQFKSTSWNAPKGGHHRSGALGFKSDQPLLQPDTKYIELVIKDVAKVPERVLRWDLRPVS